ncbi:hypothetical protein DPMN_178289 [Dreissena polymorpha]|uniref:Uncharacterized protein n=1 Tax=Dreissena polymorpha TaxID=45954 RepID=A0A9D4IJR0_DREPO|nr:hypothetical protein DPMN_178289 [Dreissena polymorpha]
MVLYNPLPYKGNITINPCGWTSYSYASSVQKNGFSIPWPKSDGQSHVKKTWETFFQQKMRFLEMKRYLPMGIRADLVARGLLNPEKTITMGADHRPNETNAPDQCIQVMNKTAFSAIKSENLKHINATVEKEIDKRNSNGAANNDSELKNADTFVGYARKQLKELDEFLKIVDAIITENKANPIVYKDTPVDALINEIDEVLKKNEIHSLDDSVNDARMAKIATQINANVCDVFQSVSQEKITFSDELSEATDLLENIVESSRCESFESTDSNNSNSGYSTVQNTRKRDVTEQSFSDNHEKKTKFAYKRITFDLDQKNPPATILLETNCKIQQPVRLTAKRAAPKGEATLQSETTPPKKRKFSFQPVSFP